MDHGGGSEAFYQNDISLIEDAPSILLEILMRAFRCFVFLLPNEEAKINLLFCNYNDTELLHSNEIKRDELF